MVSALAGLEALGAGWLASTSDSSRLGATLGSPAYLGAALCLLIPIAVGVAREPSGWRWVGLAGAFSGVVVLGGTGTRAAGLGLLAAAIFAMAKLRPKPRMSLAVAGVATAAILTLLPLGQRVVDGATAGRIDEWSTAATALADRPFLGTGLEGYRLVFPAHVDVGYVRNYGRTTVTDRAHSGPLDLGVAMGVPGLVVWLVAAAWAVRRAWHVMDAATPAVAGMAAGSVAWFVQELLLFPTVEVGVMGWAVVGAMSTAANDRRTVSLRSRPGAVMAALLFTALAGGGLLGVAADRAAAEAVESGSTDSAGRAVDLRPDSYLYRLLVADTALKAADPEKARAAVDAALRLAPDDPGVRMADTRLLRIEVARGADPIDAARRVGDLVDDDPNHPELRLIHGDLLARAGDPARAERAWLAAETLSPTDPAPALRLASLYLSVERLGAARDALDRARALDPDNPDIAVLGEAIDDG